MSSVSVVAHAQDQVGECPIWCPATSRLYWIDIRAPALRRVSPMDGKVESWILPEFVGSFAIREAGGFLIALQSGFYRSEEFGGGLSLIHAPEPDLPKNRLNDGRCDPAGRFWVGSMQDFGGPPAGSLYRLDPDGSCHRMLPGLTMPNGLAWTPDGATMYLADSWHGTIRAFPFAVDSGTIGTPRLFVDTTQHPGKPDGSAMDADGCLWSAEYGGWRVVRYARDGTIDRTIKLPVAQVAACAFGGPDLRTLYITTARQKLGAEALASQPLAGAVFAVQPGVAGIPEPRFAG
jgi:sugar lactone lactonase YvrE